MRIVSRVFEALHCVRLSSACLTIRQYGCVVALQNRLDGLLGRTLIHVLL